MAEVHVSDISLERRNKGRQTLQDLELQLKSSRKERFQKKKLHTEQQSQRQKIISELKRELDKDHKHHDHQLSTKNRISQKLHDVYSTLHVDVDLSVMKEQFKQRRRDLQLKALSSHLSASKPDEISNISQVRSDSFTNTPIWDATQQLARCEARLVNSTSDIERLRHDRLAMQQCDDTLETDAKVQDMANRIAGESAKMSASKATEIRKLQQLAQELEKQLEDETIKATRAAVSAVAVVQMTPTSGSCSSPILDPQVIDTAPCVTPSLPNNDLNVPAPAEEDVIVATTSTVAKGKGKGKGKAPIPKCPQIVKAPPAKGAAKGASSEGAPSRGSNLVNLHWKVLKEEPGLDTLTPSKDNGFLAKTAQLAASFATSSSSPSIVRAARRQELRLPETKQSPDDNSIAAVRRDTIFSCPTDVKVMPKNLLETLFKARTTAIKMPGASSESSTETREARKPLFDVKFLRMLGIALQIYAMHDKDAKGFAGVLSIKRGVLRCEYSNVSAEMLATFCTVLREHAANDAKLTKLVKEEGEDALLRLQNSLEHRLIHELLKVPQIDERLECMLFQTQFNDLLKICHRRLGILKHALKLLDSKRSVFSRFFNIALKFGQSMNRDCRAPQASRGFTLSSFDKMVQTKSTRSPKHNVLHFILALMDSDDLDQLFTSKDVAVLGEAKSIKSYLVYQDCVELVQGFSGMREICETGNYKSRSSNGGVVKMEQKRKSICPGKRPTEVDNDDLDNDDRFHDEMKEFVDDNLDEIQGIAKDCFNVFKMYKELAIFFGDVRSVYPPPRGEQTDLKADIVAVFHHLAKQVIAHKEEMRHDQLKDVVGLVLDINIATQEA